MFYTKYRPQKFSDISRPNEAADALSKQIQTDKTVHAYLFIGPRGTGKTSTARIFAKALNCHAVTKDGDPCDICNSCLSIKNGTFIDLIEIDAASNRGIDDIRDLKEKIKLAPAIGDKKIYIIDEVHMLTSEAFNALLKTLEEPPRNALFILCTTEAHKVPDTIKSRCQIFKFRRATVKQLVTKLANIAAEEDLKIEQNDLEKIARASLGGFRDAETMLQQVAEGDISVDTLLNVGSREKYLEFMDCINANEVSAAIKIVNKAFDEGLDLYIWTGELLNHLRDLLLLKSGLSSADLDLTANLEDDFNAQSRHIALPKLVTCLDKFSEAQTKIKNSFIPQLPLELAIINICSDLSSIAAVTAPIDAGPLPSVPNLPKNQNSTKTQGLPKTQSSSTAKSETKAQSSSASKIETKPQKEVTLTKSVKEPEGDIVTISADEITSLAVIEEKWSDVITRIDSINKSILGLLKTGKPTKVDGQYLVIEVSYSFHKERLESPKNRKVVEDVLRDIFNASIKVKCIVTEEKPKRKNTTESGVLTDMNVVPVSKEKVLDMLDGGLPL